VSPQFELRFYPFVRALTLTEPPRKELLLTQSSDIRSGPCGSYSLYLCLGIEGAVVQQIAASMRRARISYGGRHRHFAEDRLGEVD
jgi:hypothetical protein